MKRPTLAGALPILLMAVVVSAQVPTKMSYQGVLTDGSGAPVADGSHSLVFKLYNVSTGGAALWTETQGSVNTTNGVLSVVLGSVMPIGIVFDGALWLGIAVDGGGELTPRIELTTSPYAFTASDVDDDAVTSAKIADGAVTTADIADGTVASADIADGTVAAADILDGTITAADVAAAQVVKSVNTLTDAVTLTAGTNMTITPAGNVLTFDATVAGGNTLDMAYDQGGAGAGRTITADNGAVDITGTDGLQVTNSSVLFTGTTGTIPATGAGTRLMWYPAKDAFRAGVVAGTQWDDANIGDESTVTGGSDNIASGQRSVVSGGVTNTASGITSTIGGGQGNTATALNATVAGGTFNDATQSQTAIGGGTGNTASAVGSTVSGGSTNTASGNTATVGGGATNTASGQDAVVAGGSNNMATATRSMIPGGYLNTAAGLYSFAAGRRAKANHAGAFVWGDQTDADFVSTAADQFLIRAGGGVGIGTASPSGVLHVLETVAQPAKAYIESPSGNGSQLIVKVGDATSVSHLYFGDTGADNSGQVTYNHTSNSMHFSTNATQVATIDNAGNVGIGTTSPSNRLHVDLTGSNEVRIDKNVDWVGSGFTQLRLSDVTTPNKMLRIGYSAVGDFAVLQSQEAGVVVKPLTLNPNGGNVGIGTTSPDVRLDIVGDPNGAVRISDTDADVTSKNLSIVGTQNTNADGLWRVIGGSANGTANIADIGGGWAGYDAASLIRFYTAPAINTAGTERMRIDGNGNVGIGTTNSSGTGGKVVHLSGSGGTTAYIVEDTGAPRKWAWIVGTTGDMFLQDVTAGNLNRFKIDTSGRVGVGNFVLTEAFQVAGNAAPSGDNSFSLGTAGLRWTDVFAVSGSVNASDRRMKENIEDTQYGLDEIMELRPVSYTWKDRPERGTKLGLIAQEVQPLISEVVHVGDDPDATLGLYYSDLVPVLIKAIQEQQDIIERQESEKVQLKSELSGTQEDVEALKTQMSELTAVIAMIKTSMAQDEQASAEGLDGAVVASASE